MRDFLPCRSGLLAVLFSSAVALAGGPYGKTVIRTEKISDHPGTPTSSVHVSGQVATVLRFEKDVDPAKTKLLAWEGRFEPLLVGSKKVVIEPLRDLGRDEWVPLLVTLVDGTEIPFIVKPPFTRDDGGWEGWTDHQVNVFKNHDSYNAVLSSLYDSLKKERELSEENERFKKEENSVDHAYATLLANGEVKKTPFRRKVVYRPKNEDMDMVVEVFSGQGKAAAVVTLTNTYYGDTWKFDGAYLTRDFTSVTARPFALRMTRAAIVPGQTGTIAVVVDREAFAAKDGELADLALQIFRGDGLLQVVVTLDHTLIRE
ncbi:DUF2381 family protein [Stigmatella erecta]|uniref:DUF2381 family protein n=1 Tax=Stigmatella erecta TaxID=83460 RepID=A0A1I0ITN2_9BACT|nr:DUF2381 family protein [Stigmatella erecta]SEU00672.1 Protein of unknown function [Stigmatella erecta]